MKSFFGHRHFWPRTRISLSLIGITAGLLVFCGCNKPKVETAAPPVVADNPNPTPPVAPPSQVSPAAPVTIAASTSGGADLKQLNHAYIGWIVQNRRRPKTFEEYVSASGVQVPPAPAGKKYIIDKSGFIALVGQ